MYRHGDVYIVLYIHAHFTIFIHFFILFVNTVQGSSGSSEVHNILNTHGVKLCHMVNAFVCNLLHKPKIEGKSTGLECLPLGVICQLYY